MKERPILMNAEMVRATLDGRKTQTRRVIKKQFNRLLAKGFLDGEQVIETSSGYIKSPYGKVGDRLWVRETFVSLQGGSYEDMKPREGYSIIRYKADDALSGLDADTRGYPYRPSIHMPRWASRINLEITDIRVERVQDISEGDAEREGGIFVDFGKNQWGNQRPGWRCDRKPERHQEALNSARGAFWNLWDKINIKRGYGWHTNPWVWVIEFKVVDA